MKRLMLTLAVWLGVFISARAQTAQTLLLEHFTNTRCSICASKNPAFYQTLSNYPQVLHLAFHPSSPYSQCYFSLQNPDENDARANYYNAYGSTPKVALNGKLLPGSSTLINNTTFDTAITHTSPVEITATEELLGADSMQVSIAVRTTGSVPVANALLFAGIAEEPVNYNAQNGETVHHDVFRQALTAVEGNQIAIPALNDSLVLGFTYALNSGWNVNNIYTLTFFQRADTKEILNAAKSHRMNAVPASIAETDNQRFTLFPNPAYHQLHIAGLPSLNKSNYSILNTTGQKIASGEIVNNRIDLSKLPKGLYYLKIENAVSKFLKL